MHKLAIIFILCFFCCLLIVEGAPQQRKDGIFIDINVNVNGSDEKKETSSKKIHNPDGQSNHLNEEQPIHSNNQTTSSETNPSTIDQSSREYMQTFQQVFSSKDETMLSENFILFSQEINKVCYHDILAHYPLDYQDDPLRN